MKKVIILISVIIIILISLVFKYIHFYVDVSIRDEYLIEKLRIYRTCQISYYGAEGHYFPPGFEDQACYPLKEVKLYFSLSEFQKAHPDLCPNLTVEIKPHSFTIIGETNIDGENKILSVNDSGVVLPVKYLPVFNGKCPDNNK